MPQLFHHVLLQMHDSLPEERFVPLFRRMPFEVQLMFAQAALASDNRRPHVLFSQWFLDWAVAMQENGKFAAVQQAIRTGVQ